VSAIWDSWTSGYTCWVWYVLTLAIFQHPRLCKMMMMWLRTIDMSIRFEVNQSTFVHVWSFRWESYLFVFIIIVKDYVIIIVPLCNRHCNDTLEICLLMCATVSHIWVFYASYFVLEIWVTYWLETCTSLWLLVWNLKTGLSVENSTVLLYVYRH